MELPIRNLRCISLVACIFLAAGITNAKEPNFQYGGVSADMVAVPQNLLGLSHTPEVQAELLTSAEQIAEWERVLREIDASWWPARILPADQQRKIIADLEIQLVQTLERMRGKEAVQRLRQIELQSQGARILLRPEVIAYLRLTDQQNTKLTTLFSETDALAKSLKPDDSAKMQQLAAAKKSEVPKALAVLSPVQTESLRMLMGQNFDTAKLERIYPFAPELIDSDHWTSSVKPSLESLRGKVVLVHFYAFQCHNCVANFEHYKRWDETLKSKGVEVIGIQTPETDAERDADKVISASKKEGFEFPVLIDLETKNWDAWGNTMWPTVYVIDKQGYIRFWWQGELNWQGATVDQKIEKIVDQLLKEK